MCLSLATLTSIIGTGWPIMVELIDLMNSDGWFSYLDPWLWLSQFFSFRFLSSDTIICSTMAFPPLVNSDHVVVSVSINFLLNTKWDAHFIACLMTFFVLIGMVFVIIWEIFHGRMCLNSSFSAAASEFHEWIQVGKYVYIPHGKYQVKPHSSSWFSVACTATMIQRNYVFLLHQQNKSSESKIKFRQTSNCSKRVLEAVKLAYANKTKEFIPSHKLGFGGFGRIANSAFSRGK